MTIERDPRIRFHEAGTLNAVTRWISSHDEGIAEWLKNARRAYQVDRANVDEPDRVAVLLLRDADGEVPGRIGLLDVGGAALEDVDAWSTWQDPTASHRGSGVPEEDTQGNGGKAYMYRLFHGPARIIGVRDDTRNCKGFDGPPGVDRGTPGFVPSAAAGREVPIPSWEAELNTAIAPYGLTTEDLPEEMAMALRTRRSFTLVEGEDPDQLYRGRIDATDLVQRVMWHEQATLAIDQLRLYVVHNGRVINDDQPVRPEPVIPYPGFEEPEVIEIPDELPLSGGQTVSTTEAGTKPRGRLILFTSKQSMPEAYKRLKPRWRISYRTGAQMIASIGSKPISELVPTTPGSTFVYGQIELAALEPGYVDHGRRRPKNGPLVEALDLFIADHVRALARRINATRRHELDERALDEVHRENEMLDEFKNRFLQSEGPGSGGSGTNGEGPDEPPPAPPPPPAIDTPPEEIQLTRAPQTLRVAQGLRLDVRQLLGVRVVDATGRPVMRARLEWSTTHPDVVRVDSDGNLVSVTKGRAEIWATATGTSVESRRLPVEVWALDHVLLTPRNMEIPLGRRSEVTAEVTNDEANRATDVILDWRHDADDSLIIRVSPRGIVTGNRIGRTALIAGAGDPEHGGVWARIPCEIEVVPNPERPDRGGGFPKLLLTGRDADPATGEIRDGDPEAPALWQETSDFMHNVWWLNLESPEAVYAFSKRAEDPALWRNFHVQKVVEMVIQVEMQNEYTKRGDEERPELWLQHRNALDRYVVMTTRVMWDRLQPYVDDGAELS